MFQSIALSSLTGKLVFADYIKKKTSKYNSILRLNAISNKNFILNNSNFFFLILDKISHIILSSLDYFDALEYSKVDLENKFFFKIPDCSANTEVNNIVLKNNRLKDYFLYSPFVTVLDLFTEYDNNISVAIFQFFQFPILKKESSEFVYTWKKNLDTYYEMKKKGLLTII